MLQVLMINHYINEMDAILGAWSIKQLLIIIAIPLGPLFVLILLAFLFKCLGGEGRRWGGSGDGGGGGCGGGGCGGCGGCGGGG